MKITIVTVGKVKEKFYRDAIAEYAKRLGRYCTLEILEVADEKTPDGAAPALEQQIIEKEGSACGKIPCDPTSSEADCEYLLDLNNCFFILAIVLLTVSLKW